MFHDGEFKVDEVVGVDPVLGGLTHECALATTRTSVALDGMASGADEVI